MSRPCAASLRSSPLKGKRSVVCAASYEARQFGVRSAIAGCNGRTALPKRSLRSLPTSHAIKPSRKPYARSSSTARRHRTPAHWTRRTPGCGPKINWACRPPLWLRRQSVSRIREELDLTALGGHRPPNKFLAKIALDWKKPNGQFVIQPHEVQAFLLPLPVGRIPGVGKVTEARMAQVGIKTVGDIWAMEMSTLEEHFGRYALRAL